MSRGSGNRLSAARAICSECGRSIALLNDSRDYLGRVSLRDHMIRLGVRCVGFRVSASAIEAAR